MGLCTQTAQPTGRLLSTPDVDDPRLQPWLADELRARVHLASAAFSFSSLDFHNRHHVQLVEELLRVLDVQRPRPPFLQDIRRRQPRVQMSNYATRALHHCRREMSDLSITASATTPTPSHMYILFTVLDRDLDISLRRQPVCTLAQRPFAIG
ncbi:MAG: hypothetical protein Q9203_004313 [Teloschistes exilis]